MAFIKEFGRKFGRTLKVKVAQLCPALFDHMD